ncbi:MAG: heat-inducible transcriptional repressor HrcA [Microcoleaceae cyanobacterium]
MSLQVKLTERQQHILWATVRHYIATAEPVGSKVLAKEYDLNVSPATIRNGMGLLEKEGLLYQPHTSAGRVPSDFGYRIYVDQLISPVETLAQQVTQLLREQLDHQSSSVETILKGAAQILSSLSGYITLITMPQTITDCLRHLQLVLIDPKTVMLVVVTDAYQTQSSVMELSSQADTVTPSSSSSSSSSATNSLPLPEDEELIEQELQLLSNFLNHHLRGRSLTELATLDWQALDREFQRYADFLRELLTNFSRRHQIPDYTRIQFSGVSEVLRQPEFSQLQQVQTLMHLLEDEQESLWPLIVQLPNEEETVNIRIGAENPLEPIQTCTLICAPYHRDTVPVGSVGMLGPTRMMYENAITLVEATANYLSEILGKN